LPQKIVQINFSYKAEKEAMLEGAREMVEPVSQVPGLVWKIWIHNEEEKTAGGIYLFEDRNLAEGYLRGPIVEQLKTMPWISGFSAKIFDIMQAPSQTTRAPL